MEDLPQKIRHTTNVTENLSVSVGQTFATVPMWKIRHTTVIGWGRGGWVGRVGVGGLWSGGWGRGLRSGELGQGIGVGGFPTLPNPPDPNSPNPPDPTFPTSTLLTPTVSTQPPLPTPTYHRCVANLPHRHCCKRLSDACAQILAHIRMSHLLCGESSGKRCA